MQVGGPQNETTKPIGPVAQDNFINGAVLLETALGMERLRTEFKEIESNLGRKTTDDPSGPRTIDLDIIVWNGTVVDEDFYKRGYLRQSVLELIPDLPH